MRKTAILIALLAAPGAGWAAEHAAAGQALAREHCAHCPDVEAGGAMKMHPPSFAAIARFRPEDQIRARIWFPSLHSVMPPMMNLLTFENVDVLTDYILSLE